MYRYSHRLSWNLPPNSFSDLLVRKRGAGTSLCDLTVSNPTEVLASYPHLQIAESLAHVNNLRYEPHPFGSLFARQAIVAYYGDRGVAISPDRIALTASTSEAYSLLFKLLCNPEDEILVPVPSYPLFEYLAALECVRAVPYRLLYDGSWYIDFSDLRTKVTRSTRAIVLVNPNNPTGSFLKEAELELLTEIASTAKVPVISDEVFMDYSLAPVSTPIRKTLAGFDSMLSFSLNGLSKSAGMPQMKLGWIVINGPASDVAEASHHLELILDTYLSVGTPVQQVLPDLFRIGKTIQHQLQKHMCINWEAANHILQNTAAQCLRVEGGWSAPVRLPNMQSEDSWLKTLLAEQSVVVQPGYFFDMPAEPHIVVSLITPPRDFHKGLTRLRTLVSRFIQARTSVLSP